MTNKIRGQITENIKEDKIIVNNVDKKLGDIHITYFFINEGKEKVKNKIENTVQKIYYKKQKKILMEQLQGKHQKTYFREND